MTRGGVAWLVGTVGEAVSAKRKELRESYGDGVPHVTVPLLYEKRLTKLAKAQKKLPTFP